MRLKDCTEIGRIDSKREHTFQVRWPGKAWTLSASAASILDEWLKALQGEHSRYATDGSAIDLDDR